MSNLTTHLSKPPSWWLATQLVGFGFCDMVEAAPFSQ